MRHFCDINQLSAEGRWEEVFNCLGIDQNTTIDLSDLKVQNATDDLVKDTMNPNTLDIVLGLIWLADQLFFVALMVYCVLYLQCYLRIFLSPVVIKCRKRFFK